jgi:hypothetical protein
VSGLPKTSGQNDTGVCTGDWAGHTDTDDRHCVCWWDDRGPCCQCGADAGVEPKPWPPMPVSTSSLDAGLADWSFNHWVRSVEEE